MTEYRLDKKQRLYILIIGLIFTLSCTLLAYIFYDNFSIIKYPGILIPITLIISIALGMTCCRIDKAIAHDDKLYIQRLSKFKIHKANISWSEIEYIGYNKSFRNSTSINIKCGDKEEQIEISKYSNYKKLLETIIENTKDNKNIQIEQKVFDLLDK